MELPDKTKTFLSARKKKFLLFVAAPNARRAGALALVQSGIGVTHDRLLGGARPERHVEQGYLHASELSSADLRPRPCSSGAQRCASILPWLCSPIRPKRDDSLKTVFGRGSLILPKPPGGAALCRASDENARPDQVASGFELTAIPTFAAAASGMLPLDAFTSA